MRISNSGLWTSTFKSVFCKTEAATLLLMSSEWYGKSLSALLVITLKVLALLFCAISVPTLIISSKSGAIEVTNEKEEIPGISFNFSLTFSNSTPLRFIYIWSCWTLYVSSVNSFKESFILFANFFIKSLMFFPLVDNSPYLTITTFEFIFTSLSNQLTTFLIATWTLHHL